MHGFAHTKVPMPTGIAIASAQRATVMLIVLTVSGCQIHPQPIGVICSVERPVQSDQSKSDSGAEPNPKACRGRIRSSPFVESLDDFRHEQSHHERDKQVPWG